jgi:uncharacterized metal-binding protein YceD (DUF177 family)
MNTISRGLQIRIEGSQNEGEVLFEECVSHELLDLHRDDELSPVSDIFVTGKAYRTQEWIMIEAQVKVSMRLPCSMCNELCTFAIELLPWEESVEARSVKDGMVDLSQELRDAILLEVPFYTRCGSDTCRNIDEFQKYLAPENRAAADGEEKNQPFLSLL